MNSTQSGWGRGLTPRGIRGAIPGVLIGLLVVMSLPGTGQVTGTHPPGLQVTFMDVGQGDAILVTCPDGEHHLLIDAGDSRYPGSADHFRSQLARSFPGGTPRLDLVVATHSHADHIGSMEWVLTNCSVGTYLDNGDPSSETAPAGRLRRLVRRLATSGKLRHLTAAETSFARVDFCPSVTNRILSPWSVQRKLSGPNDRSVAVRLDGGGVSFLFVGDLGGDAETAMLERFTPEQRALLRADVLKVGHHASHTSSRPELILAVSPRLAVVSVGQKGTGTNVRYRHPRLSTVRNYLDWFRHQGPGVESPGGMIAAYDTTGRVWRQEHRPAGMWLTVADGTVTVSAEGGRLTVTTNRAPEGVHLTRSSSSHERITHP